ncbi:hypothetical protein SO802_012516 [Lithocarpus litseifolius]|uniref:Uncharacterized protein n=1 Tax=Lithocarpus litseifolius TaxID=425828 RepID=A0AAW2D6K0_9ROSI
MEKHTLPLLGSTQRKEDSKREIIVIVACIIEEDGEVIMDLEQTDEQETPEAFATLKIAEEKFLFVSKSQILILKLQLLHELTLHRGHPKLAQQVCDKLGVLTSSVTGVDMELKTEASLRHASAIPRATAASVVDSRARGLRIVAASDVDSRAGGSRIVASSAEDSRVGGSRAVAASSTGVRTSTAPLTIYGGCANNWFLHLEKCSMELRLTCSELSTMRTHHLARLYHYDANTQCMRLLLPFNLYMICDWRLGTYELVCLHLANCRICLEHDR